MIKTIEGLEAFILKHKPSRLKIGGFEFEASPLTYLEEVESIDERDPVSMEEYNKVKEKQDEEEYLALLGHSAE